MNSSFAPPGPRVRNSLMTIGEVIVGEGDGEGDGDEDGDGVGEGEGVGVGVGVGEEPHKFSDDAVLRGAALAAVMSALLLSVSVQPLLLLKSARVLLGAGAAPAPSKHVAEP